MRLCGKCNTQRPATQFYRMSSASDGLQRWCKECSKASVKRFAQENPARKKAANNRYAQTLRGVALSLLTHSRQRAIGDGKSRKSMSHDIDNQFVIEKLTQGVCQATGWKVDITAPPRHFNRPSLDRIDSGKGYTKENTRLVCWGVNNMLGNYGQDKLIEVAEAMRRNVYQG